MRAFIIAAAAIAAFHTAPALAWGKTGHRVVGAIAEHYLTPQAERGVTAILGKESVAEVANWPDFMRSDPSPFWQNVANNWHYVTVPEGKRYEDVGVPPQGDAVTALDRFSKTIRDPKAPLGDKQLALRFIIHIVGDLHQPLHARNEKDEGGHDVKVTFFGRPSDLHVVWDADIIDDQQLSYTEWTQWLTAKIGPDQVKAWCDVRPQTWIAEDVALRDHVYPDKSDISFPYVFAHKGEIEQRLSMGGVRLACYLNQLFGGTER